MRKFFAIVLACLMVLSMTACGTDLLSGKDGWCNMKVGDIKYSVSLGENPEYAMTHNPETENFIYLFKDEANAFVGICFNGSLSSVQQAMESCAEKIESRQDDNTIYTLYKNNDTSVATTYFFIADLKNKDGFFSFETEGDVETLKEIYEKIIIK